jgi:hypothetical protein
MFSARPARPWRLFLLAAGLLLATGCQATGMGWIPSASLADPTAKATFGFVYDGTTETFSGSYHDNALGVAFKGTGVIKAGPPPAGVNAKGGCLMGEPSYESQNSSRPGGGLLLLVVCDLDRAGNDFIYIQVETGPYAGYSNSGMPSGNITVRSS